MTEKAKLAQQYADSKVEERKEYLNYDFHRRKILTKFDGYDIEQAYEDGFDKAISCYRNLIWHDVAEELPEKRRNVLATTASPKGRGIMEGGVTVVTNRGLLEADKNGTFKKWAYLKDLFPEDIKY